MAQANQQELFSFANNFWGEGDAGVSALLTRVNDVKHTADELRNFYRERALIEDEYSRKLTALSRKALGTYEIGTLKQAFENIRQTTEVMGKSHATAAAQIRAELDDPLAAFTNNLRSRRKTVQVLIEKLTKTKQTHNASVERARERFELDCNKINGYYAQQNLLMGKELERNNMKLDKVHVTVESSKRDYQNALRLLAEATDMWAKEWKLACDKFQDLDEERVNFLKSNLWAYTNVVSTVCVSDDEGCESIRVSLEKTDVMSDNELFVRTNATGSEIIDPPAFVNYLNGKSSDANSKTFKTAKFPRLSQIGLENPEFNPTASVRASRDRRSNGPATLTQVQEQRTSPYQQQPDRSNPYTANENNTALRDIPSLNHPNDAYDSQRSSPTQRMGSLPSDPASVPNQDIDHHGPTNMKNVYPKNPSTNNNPDLHNGRVTPSRLVLPSETKHRHPIHHEEPQAGSSPYSDSPYSSNHADSATNLESPAPVLQTPSASPERKPIPTHSAPSISKSNSSGSTGNDNSNLPNLNSNPRLSPAADDSQENSPKKRTWASPFRRRSKKDLNKAYNAGVSTGSNGAPQASSTPNSGNTPKHQASQASFNNVNPQNAYGHNSRPGSAANMAPMSSAPVPRKPIHNASNDINNNNNPNNNNVSPQASNSPNKPKNDPSRASTVLSMGDNLFDLGINPAPNSYDGLRSKSASPTKSFGRDDPLVKALEKLKVTGGASAAPDDMPNHPGRGNRSSMPQQQQPPGGNMGSKMNTKSMSNTSMHSGGSGGTNNSGNYGQPRPSQHQQYGNSAQGGGNHQGYNQANSRSNPALRHQNSGSALVPPGPAFTSNDMQAASDKYSNQTREMFDQRDQQQPGRGGPDGYYNRPSMDRRAVSPNPQNQQMQRPRTMYDGDFQNMNQYGGNNMGGPGNGGQPTHQRSHSATPAKQRPSYGSDRYGPSGYANGRSPSPNPMMMNNGRSPSPNPMMMNNNNDPNMRGRSPSPNPMMMNNGRSPSPNPMMMNDGRGRSPSPNPMMMNNGRGRSPSPNPMMMNDGRGRSPSPNPMMMMNNGRSPSPNPMMMRDRSRSPNPAGGYGNMPPSDYGRYSRPGSAFGNNGPPGTHNRGVSPGPGMMGGGNDGGSQMGHDPMNRARSRNRNDFYEGNNGHGSYTGSSSSMMANNNGNSNDPARNKTSINPRPSNGSFISNASGSAMFNGRMNRGNSMDHRMEGGNNNGPPSRNSSNVGLSGNNAGGGRGGGGPNGDLPTMSRDGRQVIHYAQANFDYRAAIPEEVSFRQGDVLLVVKMLEDGWWEAEVYGEGRMGLAPSNFLSDF